MYFERVLVRGDNGEQVTQLQEWLRHLGHYEGAVDGDFGDVTELALQRFQEAYGLERDGQVQAATWDTLQLNAGYQAQPETQPEEHGQERQWSEDGKWWWDGTDWRAAEGHAETHAETHAVHHQETTVTVSVTVGQLSEDGAWQWDGQQRLAAQMAQVADFLGDQAEEMDNSKKKPKGRSEADARKLVDKHVEPKDCFIWYLNSKEGWGPIPGTGCAHWVAHQRGGPSGTSNACQKGFLFRVDDVLGSLSKISDDLSGAQVGGVWSAPAGQSHIGIVRAVNRDPKTNAVTSVDVENDSSASGGAVTQNKTSGSIYN